MSQLHAPISLRLFRSSARLLELLSRRILSFDFLLKSSLLFLFAFILYAAITTGSLFNNFDELYSTRLGYYFFTAGSLYAASMVLVTLIRALMVMSYKPTPSLPDHKLPSVTIIIPAFNEGPGVAHSIDSIARSNYPRHKLQIIAIDDGSKDDTWHHMDSAAKRHPDIVAAIRMDKNGGKRQGLRVGFALAHGDVIVTMDSDSVVEPDSLRNLVTPIAADPRIGAVAGNVKVQNRNAGILPRMMKASFVLAFDFTRAYQSQIKAVLCTPGAFSAYRRSAVEAVLNDWNNQSWCGKPSTIAEDRALTNLILREGHEITFQSTAVVYTNVPTTYSTMAKMYQRWERGNLRENLTYATFAFCFRGRAPFRKRYRLLANTEWALSVADMFAPYALIIASLAYSLINPFFLLKYLSFIIIFASIMQSYYYLKERNSDCIYGVLYSLFWFTMFWWVVPYSILTANNGSWMTRTLPSSSTDNQPLTTDNSPLETPKRIAA